MQTRGLCCKPNPKLQPQHQLCSLNFPKFISWGDIICFLERWVRTQQRVSLATRVSPPSLVPEGGVNQTSGRQAARCRPRSLSATSSSCACYGGAGRQSSQVGRQAACPQPDPEPCCMPTTGQMTPTRNSMVGGLNSLLGWGPLSPPAHSPLGSAPTQAKATPPRKPTPSGAL